jgi:glycosyltransferase involved in cell wall biosynthesis
MDGLLKGPLSPGLLAAAVRLARRSDVVLATNIPFTAMLIGLLAGRLTGTPVVMLPFLHLRDPYHHRPMVRQALGRADRVLCLSRTNCAFVERAWGGSATFVGGGIDPEEYSGPAIDPHAFRQTHELGPTPIVLTVARKTPSKGYQLTVEAVREVRRRGLNCQHVLIGPDEDGLPLDTETCRYLGRQPRAQVLSALAACDVFSLPSMYESFGLAYLEAWMLGRPVIGHTLCDPARELIEPERDGVLVSEVREMVQALEALMSDPARNRAFGEDGRRKALSHYTWKHVVDRTLQALSEVVARQGSRM